MNPTFERWLPVAGYQGLYEVSDQGRVRSIDRVDARGYRFRGRVLRPVLKDGRYFCVSLSRDGRVAHRRLHHLVLEAFAAARPPGLYGLHRDDDRSNNTASNLYWGTLVENAADKARNGGNFFSNKTHCKRGHLLSAPNLKPSSRARCCLACDRTGNLCRRRGVPFDPLMADEKYRAIMTG